MLDCREPGAGGEHGGVVGVRAGAGVGVDAAASGGAEPLHGIEVRRRMDQLELGAGGGPGLDRRPDASATSARRIAVEHGLESRRALGMARPGDVVEVAGMGQEQDRHEARQYRRNSASSTLRS